MCVCVYVCARVCVRVCVLTCKDSVTLKMASLSSKFCHAISEAFYSCDKKEYMYDGHMYMYMYIHMKTPGLVSQVHERNGMLNG